MEADPEFYQSFYEKIQELIEKLNKASEAEYADMFERNRFFAAEFLKAGRIPYGKRTRFKTDRLAQKS